MNGAVPKADFVRGQNKLIGGNHVKKNSWFRDADVGNTAVGMQTGKNLFTDTSAVARKNGDLATGKDSTFVQTYHPTFTGGYFSKTMKEMDDRPENLPKPTRQMDSDHIQANKIQQAKAINIAKTKNIDVSAWKYKLDNPENL